MHVNISEYEYEYEYEYMIQCTILLPNAIICTSDDIS